MKNNKSILFNLSSFIEEYGAEHLFLDDDMFYIVTESGKICQLADNANDMEPVDKSWAYLENNCICMDEFSYDCEGIVLHYSEHAIVTAIDTRDHTMYDFKEKDWVELSDNDYSAIDDEIREY